MGLSASQTRFLNLTARKSNVEFQGQQINQARTELANQSSALFTQMMSLKMPTVPSVYTYVIDPAKKPDIDWSQSYSYPLNKADNKNFLIYYAGNEPSFKDFNIPEYKKNVAEDKTVTFQKISYNDKGDVVYGPKIAEADMTGTYYYMDEGQDAAGNKVQFPNIHVDAAEKFTYDIKTGLFVAKTQPDGKTLEEIPNYIVAYNVAMMQYKTYSDPKDSTVAIYPLDTKDTSNADPIAYKFPASENVNTSQYNAAMVEYEKEMEEYNEEIARIETKTEEIHEADKKLEMQLKQLDTEQEAIQTEYEAVKKVIDKNIENTFKSFA